MLRCFCRFNHFFFGWHEVAQLCTWRGGSDLSNDVIISIPWTFHSFASHVPSGVWGERTYLLHTSTYIPSVYLCSNLFYILYICVYPILYYNVQMSRSDKWQFLNCFCCVWTGFPSAVALFVVRRNPKIQLEALVSKIGTVWLNGKHSAELRHKTVKEQ